MATVFGQVARVNSIEELATKRRVDAPQFIYGVTLYTWSSVSIDTAVPAAGGGFWVSTQSDKFVFVSRLADFPTPVAGVITLPANTTYFILGSINIGANRFVCGNNVTIGSPSLVSNTISATLSSGQSLFTSTGSFVMLNITVSASGAGSTIFNLDGGGSPTVRVLLREFTIVSSGLGTIKGYSAIVASTAIFADLKSTLQLDGSNGVVIFDTCQWNNLTVGVSTLTYPSTFSASIRVRHINSGFSTVGGATAINADPAIGIATNNFSIEGCIFSGGGTSLSGLTTADNKVFARENQGLASSFTASNYFMTGNATATVIAGTNTFVKVAGTTTSIAANTQRFDNTTSNRALHTGPIARKFRITSNVTMTSGNAQTLGVAIFKNGVLIPESESRTTTTGAGDASSTIAFAVVELAPSDYIEVFVKNVSAVANITVSILNLSVTTIE